MALTQEQAEQIKKQLLSQLKNLAPEQQEQVKQQIKAMNEEQLEQFLIQNKMVQQGENPKDSKASEEGGCIFCSIAEETTKSYKLDENKSAIAILDINPLSKGHSLIIPKKHKTIEKLPSSVLSLAKKIAKKIKSKLKPEEIKIETMSIQGHTIVNVIPPYKNQKLEKRSASQEELQQLQTLLEKKKKPERIRQKKYTSKPLSSLPDAPVRIP